MKRLLSVLLILLPAFISAASYDEIMSAVLSESPDAVSARLLYEDGLLSAAASMLDESPEILLTAAFEPLYNEYEALSVSTFGLDLSLPDDETVISASVPFGVRYDRRGGAVSPSVSISHTFDWGYDDDILKDLQTEALRLSAESGYYESLLSLQESAVALISSILSSEKNIAEAEEKLRDAEKELRDSLSLGIVTEDSLAAAELELARKRAEDSIRILKAEHDELAARFAVLAGAEWEGIEDIPMPSFPDLFSSAGTSALNAADIQARIAREEVLAEESEQNPGRITAGAGISGSVDIADGMDGVKYAESDDAVSMRVSGSLGLESGGWALSAEGGGSWNLDMEVTPSLTITGAWRSGTPESDDITLRSLRNTALIRENEAREARRSFNESRNSLWSRILSWERDWAELEAEMEYERALLEMASIKHERGMITDEELHDAAFSLRMLELERDILLLEGLSLETEAENLLV